MTLLLNATCVGLLYRWLPKRKLHWSVTRGGLLAAVVWEAGRQLLGACVNRRQIHNSLRSNWFFHRDAAVGILGVSIIFFGAEYAQVLSEERRKRKEQAAPVSEQSRAR